jgi:hypothetical protein
VEFSRSGVHAEGDFCETLLQVSSGSGAIFCTSGLHTSGGHEFSKSAFNFCSVLRIGRDREAMKSLTYG